MLLSNGLEILYFPLNPTSNPPSNPPANPTIFPIKSI